MSQEPKPRVFVVDDENVIASTLELILRSHGFDAHSFADPIAALAAAQLKSPDLLITDVIMPQMNGVELAIRIKEDCPGCRVLLFSGQGSIVDLLVEAKAAGHNFVLVNKPVHPAVLIEAINQTLQETGSLVRRTPAPVSLIC
jgi:FixJ family two-component response regulator